jgi:hypothetical protein
MEKIVHKFLKMKFFEGVVTTQTLCVFPGSIRASALKPL